MLLHACKVVISEIKSNGQRAEFLKDICREAVAKAEDEPSPNTQPGAGERTAAKVLP